MSPRAQILQWADQGHLQDLHQALQLAQVTPNRAKWRKFLSLLMLATGTLLAGAGVIFFFAYNWKGLPPLARFAIVEALLVVGFVIAWFLKIETLTGRAALFFAALMTGALFALIGQTYHLGADPWQLFALWAVLILPWAFAARQPDLWLLSLLLANVAVAACSAYSAELSYFAVLNFTAQALWEWIAPQPRLAPRLAGAATTLALTALALDQIFYHSQPFAAAYLLWLPATLVIFTKYRRDLLLVSASLLSAIVAITSLCAKGLFRSSSNDLIVSSLLIALIVIALSAAAAKWLQSLSKA